MPGIPLAARPGMNRIVDAIERLKGLYLEMPGSHLSRTDIARLSGLEPELCDSVIDALEGAAFLRRSAGERFTLNQGTPVSARLRFRAGRGEGERKAS